MTVKDIIKIVCEFVGENEIRAKLEADTTLSEREQEKVDCMVRCFNLVNQEIASDYLPFLTEESVDVSNSIINFSTLSKSVVNIYQVKNGFGMPIRFKNYPNYIEVCGNAKKVIYSYLPDELKLGDNIARLNGLTERIYAYGVASEFLLIDGLGADAEIWEERFKTSLFVLSRRKGEHRLPRRSWM